MKTSDILRILQEAGCKLIRHGASHDIWYSPITQKKFPVPRHFAKEVPNRYIKRHCKKIWS